jgi:uncharacterized membrane protein
MHKIAFWAGSLAMLAGAAQAQQTPVPQAISCRGDEPSWSLEAGQDIAKLTRPGGTVAVRGRLDVLDWLQPGWLVWRGGGARQLLTVTLRAEECRSTMAETPPMTHRAILVSNAADPVAGCCTVKLGYDAALAPVADAATKPEADWARFLPDLLPGIRRCVARLGEAADRVVKAWPMNHGMMLARIAAPGGMRQDCVVEIGGKRRIDRIDPVTAQTPPLPDEGKPVFLPFRDPAPLVTSGRLERVLDAQRRLRGWLHYPA